MQWGILKVSEFGGFVLCSVIFTMVLVAVPGFDFMPVESHNIIETSFKVTQLVTHPK